MIISTISSRDVGAGVRLGEVVFGIVEMMFAFYRHQVVVLEFFLSLQGRKDGKHYWKLVRKKKRKASVWWLAAGCNAPSWGINHSKRESFGRYIALHGKVHSGSALTPVLG